MQQPVTKDGLAHASSIAHIELGRRKGNNTSWFGTVHVIIEAFTDIHGFLFGSLYKRLPTSSTSHQSKVATHRYTHRIDKHCKDIQEEIYTRKRNMLTSSSAIIIGIVSVLALCPPSLTRPLLISPQLGSGNGLSATISSMGIPSYVIELYNTLSSMEPQVLPSYNTIRSLESIPSGTCNCRVDVVIVTVYSDIFMHVPKSKQ